MSFPASSHPARQAAIPTSIVHKAIDAFSIETDAADPHTMHLVMNLNSSRVLWTRHFGDSGDRDAVIERFVADALDLSFFGRVSAIFGPAAMSAAVEEIVLSARKVRLAQADAEATRQRDRHIVNLYAPNTKRGYNLELQRKRHADAEWSVRYDRASERDRLCDWLRWQKLRFPQFLDHAAEHGSEALTRLFLDEMFETERRVKKEGRGAGGMRPLRMWRGD